ncbi:MAG: hypothetical protein HYY22_00485 [Thaumarchaeota archaeon]|nr:hypothetical protein [Nitrososphaerota archaeon]
MKHRVTCSICGRTSRVTINLEGKILSDWAYFGRINLNEDKTSKKIYRLSEVNDEVWRLTASEKAAKGLALTNEWIEGSNPEYDPSAKPEKVEI